MTYLWLLQYQKVCTAALIPLGKSHLLGFHQPFLNHCGLASVLYNSLVVRGLLPERGHPGCSFRHLQSYTALLQRNPVGIEWQCISREHIFCSSMNQGQGRGKVTAWKWQEGRRKTSRWVWGAGGSTFTWDWADRKCWSMPWGMGSFSHDALKLTPRGLPILPGHLISHTYVKFQIPVSQKCDAGDRQMMSGTCALSYCLLHL